MRDMFRYHKGCTEIQTEVRFAIAVFFELFFHTKHTPAETVDKAKHFHSLRHNGITIVVYQRKIMLTSSAVSNVILIAEYNAIM